MTTDVAPDATLIDEATTAAPGRRAQRCARWAFGAMVVLSPTRLRLTLVFRRSPPIYGDFTDFLAFLSEIALVATLVFWVVSLVQLRQRPDLGPAFLRWPVLVLLTAGALGVPFAADPALAAWNLAHLGLLAVLALYVLAQVRGLRDLVVPTAMMVATQAVIGIAQVVGQRSVGLAKFGEHVLRPSLGVSVITTMDGTRVLRAYGLSDHPNILGGMLALGVLLLIGAYVARSGSQQSALLPVVIALGAAGLLLTFSRGAWLGALVGFGVLTGMALLGRDREHARRLGSVALSLGLLALPLVVGYRSVFSARADRSNTIATEVRSIDERKVLTDLVGRITADHPLLGVGLGGLPLVERDVEPDFRYDYQPAPSALLDVTAETGAVGGAAAFALLIAPWMVLLRRRRWWSAELATASALLAALAVVGLLDYYPWTYSPGRIWTWLVLGLWAGAYRRAREGAADRG